MPAVSFAQVRDVARWIHEELRAPRRARRAEDVRLGGPAHLRPAAPRTTYDTGRDLLRDRRRPRCPRSTLAMATVERAVHARGRRVYIDCLQNCVARAGHRPTAARARSDAGVSAPLTWTRDRRARRSRRLHAAHDARARAHGRRPLASLRESSGADLTAVLRVARRIIGIHARVADRAWAGSRGRWADSSCGASASTTSSSGPSRDVNERWAQVQNVYQRRADSSPTSWRR
jgi:hypothetical protein